MTGAPSIRSVDELLQQLASADVPGRIEAAEGLAAHAGDTRVIPALRAALHDSEDTVVTEAVVSTLLGFGSTEAADALMDSMLNDDDETAEHVSLLLAWARQD